MGRRKSDPKPIPKPKPKPKGRPSKKRASEPPKPPPRPPLEAEFDRLAGGEDKDVLEADNFPKLAEELGIEVTDPIILGVMWKMDPQTPWSLSRDEWKSGAESMGVDSVAGVKGQLKTIRKELKCPNNFKSFYGFVFTFVREVPAAKHLECETAIDYWKLILPMAPHKWDILTDWCSFIETVHKKSVSQDLWKLALEFSMTKLEDFDDSAAWPVAIDDFVEYMQKKKEEPK